jgi:hypothetical protein
LHVRVDDKSDRFVPRGNCPLSGPAAARTRFAIQFIIAILEIQLGARWPSAVCKRRQCVRIIIVLKLDTQVVDTLGLRMKRRGTPFDFALTSGSAASTTATTTPRSSTPLLAFCIIIL